MIAPECPQCGATEACGCKLETGSVDPATLAPAAIDTSSPALQRRVTFPGGNPVSDVTISEGSSIDTNAACDPESGSMSQGSPESGAVSQGADSGDQALSHKVNPRARVSVTYDWPGIELALTTGQMTYGEAAAHYKTPEGTIRKRSKRKGWMVGKKAIAALVHKQVVAAVEGATSAITQSEIEKHKRMVFDTMTKSLGMFKAKTPRSFREAETADKMARRSAGLQDDQTQVGVLLQLNEAINTHEPEAREPLEAELIEGDSVALDQ